MFILVLVLIFGITACDNGSLDITDDFSITGRPVIEDDDGDVYETYALIVLEKNGEEIERFVNDVEESLFEIDGLESGNYTLNIYRTDIEPIKKELVLTSDKENNLGDIYLKPEEIENDEKDGTLLLAINTEEEYMDNENVRLAIAHALDKTEITEDFVDAIINQFGINYEAELATRISAPTVFDYNEDINFNLDNNMEKAQNYIDNAGYEEEIEIDFYYDGPDLTFTEELKNHVVNSLDKIDGITINPITSSYEEISNNHYQFYHKTYSFHRCPYNLRNFSSIDFTEDMKIKLDEAGLNLDNKEKVAEIILEVEEMLIEKGMVIPIFHRGIFD